MKKYLTNFMLIAAAGTMFLFNGCDFESLPINIPLTVPVVVTGSNNALQELKNFCLDDYDSYNDYREDIRKLTYVEGALRVDSVSSVNLTGNIRIELKNQAGQTLFFFVLNNVKPSNYIRNPYIIPVDVNQIQILNEYIANLDNKCFQVDAQITGITGGTTPHYVRLLVDLVFEAETEL